MKFKKLLLFLLVFVTCGILYAQTHLRVSSITGHPFLPGDTAFEAGSYDSIRITIVNMDTAVFSDFIDVKVQSDSIAPIDTIFSDVSSTMILPGDSVTKVRNNYQFSSLNYFDGDNIIVVWPVARMSHDSGDADTTNVLFVSRLALISKPEKESLVLYPNPSSKYIAFDKSDGIMIKQVRIIDINGKEIYCNSVFQPLIDINEWSPGLYFIEIINSDNSRQILKMQKN